jgi:hypothetical protein
MSVTSTSTTIYPTITNAVKVEENSSVEYTFTDIIIHSSNNDNNNNINTNNIRVKGILKRTEPENDANIFMCVKSCMFITLLALTLPFIICNLCYAYTDESCVTINPPNFDINLKTYLAVDGILGAVALLGILFVAFCCIKEEPNSNNCCLKLFGNIATAFGIAWTIIGAIVFWSLIDNTKCDRSVYNYIFAQLVIKIICYSLRIISNSNNK